MAKAEPLFDLRDVINEWIDVNYGTDSDMGYALYDWSEDGDLIQAAGPTIIRVFGAD